MPKATFNKLKPDKRKQFTDAFLREFALHSYDEASLTSVVSELGIAKGSVYQYFADKLDLFTYLVGECGAVKARYIGHLKRTDFPDFWLYFRALYEHGVKFDLENPLQSHFLHKLVDNINSPSIQHLYKNMLDQTVTVFEKMVESEIAIGKFRRDIPAKTQGFFLYKASLAINDQLLALGEIDTKKSIEKGLPVFHKKEEVLLRTVDQYIEILKAALDKR
ncbi:MAG: TetR/AcrR family transcriptional regulator [Imperialibacter sp.]|uniref:TetR/AcrR family transcriptional regulator n=1 Tax=Imperialibacter sp. TaxID=2038411 RepID=UPI0032EEEE00